MLKCTTFWCLCFCIAGSPNHGNYVSLNQAIGRGKNKAANCFFFLWRLRGSFSNIWKRQLSCPSRHCVNYFTKQNVTTECLSPSGDKDVYYHACRHTGIPGVKCPGRRPLLTHPQTAVGSEPRGWNVARSWVIYAPLSPACTPGYYRHSDRILIVLYLNMLKKPWHVSRRHSMWW